MKTDYWKRLAGAARRAPNPSAEVPFGFETRVLAEWRAQRGAEESVPWARLLRGGLVCAGLIMLLSLAVNYQALREREPGSVAITDSVLRMTMLP